MPTSAAKSPDTTAHGEGGNAPTHLPLGNGMEISLVRTSGANGRQMTEEDRLRPGQARRIGLAHLRKWGLHGLMDETALLISELVTNAFQHGTGESVDVRLCQTGADSIRVEVADRSPQAPHLRRCDPLAESGRGLPIVKAIADTWGVSEDGTRTWCTLRASADRSA